MFDRLERLIGNNINKIKQKTVMVIGLGGVGSYAVETLVRNGIENIIIVDFDKVDITNKNRQIHALDNTINRNKTDVMEERIKLINNNCNVKKLNIFLNEESKDEVFNEKIDYVIDACDTISAKILIIKECIKRNIKFIVSCGTANKLDPKKLEITTLDKTSYDSLAKKLRYELRKENISNKITVVSSIEECIKSTPVGSYSPVPNTAGILLGDYVIKDIIKQEN